MKRWMLISFCWLSFIVEASILTISDGQNTNITLTDKKLNSLPQHGVTTWLPWSDTTEHYDGVKITTLAEAFTDKKISTVKLIALNGYEVEVDYQMLVLHEALIVMTINGEPLPETRAPYWLIYSVSKYPITGNQYFRNHMIWQLSEIIFQ